MDTLIQALIMGIVQGLTEFLPVSSSAHLIFVPYLFGWDDAFINSLAFSVMLHIGTLGALLLYFARDWVRLVPAGFKAIFARSFDGDEDRRLAWLLVAATIPAAVIGFLLEGVISTAIRGPLLVAFVLVVGGILLWLADRFGARSREIEDVTFPIAVGLGFAQALALIPGISRSGISIAAGRVVGLDRPAAARFSFLMATPVTAGAALFEIRKLVSRRSRRGCECRPPHRRCPGRVRVGDRRHPVPAASSSRRTRWTSSSSIASSWRLSSSRSHCRVPGRSDRRRRWRS